MRFRLMPLAPVGPLAPLCVQRALADCPVANQPFGTALQRRLLPGGDDGRGPVLATSDAWWPSLDAAAQLREGGEGTAAVGPDGAPLAWISTDGAQPISPARIVPWQNASRLIRFPWDLLAVNEELVGALQVDEIHGVVRPGVTIDGHVVVGPGTVLLPGVYLEGNVMIGRDCRIGPNCYLRGNTAIGDNCHIGQAVEIKNSILMNFPSCLYSCWK